MRIDRETLNLLRKIWYETQSRKGPSGSYTVISFEALGVSFQDARCLDLRDKGVLALSSDPHGKPGVLLKPFVANMTLTELHHYVRTL